MPDLEMLLRDVRPAPDPAWATRLDARVAARFPKPPPAWKKPLIAVREHFFAFGAVAAVGCALSRSWSSASGRTRWRRRASTAAPAAAV